MPAELEKLLDALKGLRKEVQWKPGKDISHLEKRRRMGHLAPHVTLTEYEKIISKLVNNGQNVVYLYEIRGEHYYAVRGEIHERLWLGVFGSKGLMETAFPPVNMDDYLERIRDLSDLAAMRQKARVLPSHWWWYLDEITQEAAEVYAGHA